MKKLLIIAVALMFVATGVNAQSKAVSDAVKAMTKAKAETENPKKAAAAATWVKLANAYIACYDAPAEGLLPGSPKMQTDLILKGQPALSTEQVEKADALLTAVTYVDKVLYYNEGGSLIAWTVTKPAVENALALAVEAFNKATELDSKGVQKKAITEGLNSIKNKYYDAAMYDNTLGNYSEASVNFENAMNVAANPVIGQVDSTLAYYTGVTATMAADHARAIKFYEYCQSIDFEQKGEVPAALADAYKASGDTVKCKEVLTAGFAKFPTNQSILVSLINVYRETNEDPAKVLEILKVAQNNEPNNASLVYAEGDVYKNLNKLEDAIAAFKRAGEIDPTYVYAPYSEGATYYDLAVAIQAKAQEEFDDAKYMALLEQMEKALQDAIAPFERAFEASGDNPQYKDLKFACAEYLKNIFFRFRDKDEQSKANYDKYNKFVEENK